MLATQGPLTVVEEPHAARQGASGGQIGLIQPRSSAAPKLSGAVTRNAKLIRSDYCRTVMPNMVTKTKQGVLSMLATAGTRRPGSSWSTCGRNAASSTPGGFALQQGRMGRASRGSASLAG